MNTFKDSHESWMLTVHLNLHVQNIYFAKVLTKCYLNTWVICMFDMTCICLVLSCLYRYLYSSKGTALSTYFYKFTLHIDFTVHPFYLCVSS